LEDCLSIETEQISNERLTISTNAISSHSIPPIVQSTEPSILQPSSIIWRLPKWGDRCFDSQKKIDYVVACPTSHGSGSEGIDYIHRHCFDPKCPFCYNAWAKREAEHSANRLQDVEDLYVSEQHSDVRKIRHIMYSPPQKDALNAMCTVDGFASLKSTTLKVIKASGIVGGSIIFHSHRRLRDQEHRIVRGADGKTIWYLSPHFHVHGWGFVMSIKTFRKTFPGWIYKNKGTRKSLKSSIGYLLTHTGLAYQNYDRTVHKATIRSTKRILHCITYFGCASYNKIVKDRLIQAVKYNVCSVCGLHKHSYHIGDDVSILDNAQRSNWSDEGEYSSIVKHWTFKLRKLPKLREYYTPRHKPIKKRVKKIKPWHPFTKGIVWLGVGW